MRPFTRALWVRAEAGATDGELVSLTAPAPDPAPVPDVLALALVGDRLHVAQSTAGGTTLLADAPLARGATHPVTATVRTPEDGAPS